MSLIINHDPSDYSLCPEGLHKAQIVDAVELGSIETPFGEKQMVSLVVQTELTDEEGKPFILAKRFNRSLHEKASLRIALERLNGRKFTIEQLHDGIDLEAFIGLHCSVLVVQNETTERTYANIDAFLPGSREIGTAKAKTSSGNYQRVKDREGYLEPEEFAQHVNGV